MSPGLTRENLLTTACLFIEASGVGVARSRPGEGRPNFRQRRIVAFTAACCYAKSTPRVLRCAMQPARRIEPLGWRQESGFSG
jgi:hypothetical protein